MVDKEDFNCNSDITKEKIKEFSSIVHTMRHDIRNYIAAIEGYSYLLKEEFNEDYLNRIFSNIENINNLVDRSVLLADSELEIDKITEIDLNILIKACNEIIPDTITFSNNKLLKVKGDYSKILHIFKSLLDNAVVHGKATTIEIRGISGQNGIYIIQIMNDGIKIPKEKVENLFTQLPQSLKPSSGLNLIISNKIARAHKWELQYNDTIQDKTCFELHIPESSIIG